MGCSSLNIDGVSKRVVYSESVNKMLQQTVFGPIYFNQTLTGCSSLNTRCVFIKVIYSESGKHILQPGSEFLTFMTLHFGLNLHRIT